MGHGAPAVIFCEALEVGVVQLLLQRHKGRSTGGAGVVGRAGREQRGHEGGGRNLKWRQLEEQDVLLLRGAGPLELLEEDLRALKHSEEGKS